MSDPSDNRPLREDAGDPQGTVTRQVDPAAESLANALRVSFRVLTVIMVFVVMAFLLTGFKSIEAQEIGVKRVFGKIVGTAEQGLAYTYPFPIGQIEIVNTSERSLMIDDFWMHETAADVGRELYERRAKSKGLRPGWDGALITGDRNLLHVRLTCQYAIQGAEGAVAYLQNVEDLDETVRSEVCKAAIRAGSGRTADGIKRFEKSAFTRDILERAQRGLNALTKLEGREFEAIRIRKISIEKDGWPLQAQRAYLDAQNAVSERDEVRNQALADARRILNEAAGANYEALVGRPDQFVGALEDNLASPASGEPYDLIGQYEAESDPVESARILEQIEQVLLSSSTGGEAAALIADAKAYKTQVIQSAESRAQRFAELLAEYEKAPQFMLERRWADTRDQILSNPTVEKFYIPPGREKTILRISRDPEVRKEIQRERLKLRKEQRAGSGRAARP